MFGLTPYNRRGNEISRRGDPFDFGSMLDEFFGESMMPAFFSAANPIKTDIRETEKEYVVEAEIPGAKKEDIKLELKDDVLTIAVEHNEQVNEEHNDYIRKERRYGSYSRSFQVENVRNEGVTAKYENGILAITLPKDKEVKEKRHNIDIQ